MPFSQPPSPLAPALVRVRRPWGVPLTGAVAVGLLLALGMSHAPEAEHARFAAFVAAVMTLVLSVQAFRFARLGDAIPTSVSQAVPAELGPPLQEALEALPDPVMVVGAHEPDDIVGRRIAFANAAARELFRIQRDGALLVTAVRDPEVLEATDEALFGGVDRSAAYETGGAQDRFWRAWARPLPPAPDGGRQALLYLRDETDSRRMERMRADFLANASHELRTPLASLAGFIETLRGHARDDAKARDRFLSIMASQADRMGRLIADLLSLSRIELNEHVPPSGAVDLALAATDVADALCPIAQEKGVRIDLRLPEGGRAPVVGDRDQIIQVVQNLVDNALKYSPTGAAVEVEVLTDVSLDRAQAPREPGASRMTLLTPDRAEGVRYALVRVRDHGPGVPRQALPRLTERFYRVEGQKSGERSGTGLGLAIVKHVMNRHRGGLMVESAAGDGAAFTAYFPRAEASAAVPEPAERADVAPQALDARRNKTVTQPS
ncbi:ATP-binding protein [Caulobacter sp. 17J65-9]|uniref:sensor histidine kinase n=1 Tax=Caulobacter sp. 17J65-9 TaxID=2709382 RepID=UPI0013C944E8|nr:ATP-binding protein [Caulobacter sp. 17J65-9]NEX93032.1 ATPase [Caulobacter sp. 17J65-9]